MMRTELLVLALSESFSATWADLGAWLGAEVRRVTDEAGLVASRAFALIVSAGGEEAEAIDRLPKLLALPDLPPLAVVGSETHHRIGVRVVQSGARDYLALPGDYDVLRGWLEECQRLAQARAPAGPADGAFDFSGIVGSSGELKAALDRAARVIPRADATVLITGETGTGKELLAEAIHVNSPRAGRPFIAINCAAIPASLLEAELFGFEAGAFTDARAAKPGLFEAADGGTLFLDEIGDLPVELQAKVLRVLEERTVRRLGSVRTVELDVRIVAATHARLDEAVQRGTFRQDLFYRLHVVPIELPPLRERTGDIILLAEHFLRELARRHGMRLPRLNERVRSALLAHTWPGNIRELRNVIERALLLGDGGLHVDDLFMRPSRAHAGGEDRLPFPATLDEISTAAVRMAMAATAGNKKAAADLLGISRTRLYRLLDTDTPA